MATINIKPNRGYSVIEEKMGNLTDDIMEMMEKKEISQEAAKWLLNEFKSVVRVCRDYYEATEEENDNSHSISF